jgi:hypothetical protein
VDRALKVCTGNVVDERIIRRRAGKDLPLNKVDIEGWVS